MKKFIFGLALALVLASASSASAYTYTRDLTLGATGADVVELQSMLVAGGHLVMPAGVSMGYFGTLTQSAVAKWQMSVGITPAVGYFGPISRAKASMVVTTTTTTTTSTSKLEGGDGDVQSITKTTSGTETTLGEGKTEDVLGFDLEADDNSDLDVTSVRVKIGAGALGSTRLTRYLDEVAITLDGDVVGSADASDFSRSGATSTATISLKDAVVGAGDESRFYVTLTAKDNIDTDDQDNTLTVMVDRVRVADATGAVLTESPAGISEDVDFEDSTDNDELKLQSSTDDPEARTIAVEENSTSDEEVVFAFKLKTGSDSSEIDVLTIPVVFSFDNTASGATTTSEKIISDMWLEIDGDVYDDYDLDTVTINTNASNVLATSTVTIDEGDLTIDGDDSVDVLVYVKFGKQDGQYASGVTMTGKVYGSSIEAENQEGDSVTITSASSITGEEQTLLSTGITAEYVSESFTEEKPADDLDGTIKITFNVTGMGDEFTFADDGSDFTYSLTGATEVDAAVSVKGETASGGNFTLSDGETDVVTLSVKFATTTGFVKLEVTDVAGYTVSNIITANN